MDVPCILSPVEARGDTRIMETLEPQEESHSGNGLGRWLNRRKGNSRKQSAKEWSGTDYLKKMLGEITGNGTSWEPESGLTATLIKARKYMLAQMITLRMATRSEEVEMAAFKAQIAIYHSEGRGLKEMVSGLREAFSAWVTRTRTQARDSKLNETQQQDAREAMNREMSTQQDSHSLLNAHGTKRKKPEIWEVGLMIVKKQRVQAAEDRMDTSS
ncbi:hypothetical protein EG328_004102 [Venturia inaequalis]|uniref:Uncharacterized protein n=1 Tax=Venturia inaequalis TaxID=5025 RepID=A0A8H3VFH2_VENIN|nr:hypothetical protein EG328_004102 [Venturia inaequalis]